MSAWFDDLSVAATGDAEENKEEAPWYSFSWPWRSKDDIENIINTRDEEMYQIIHNLSVRLEAQAHQSSAERKKTMETQNEIYEMSQMIQSLKLEASTCSQKIDHLDPLVKQLESQQVLQESNLQRIQKEMTQKIQELSSKGESHLQALATQQESAKKLQKFQVSTLKKLEESKEETRHLSVKLEASIGSQGNDHLRLEMISQKIDRLETLLTQHTQHEFHTRQQRQERFDLQEIQSEINRRIQDLLSKVKKQQECFEQLQECTKKLQTSQVSTQKEVADEAEMQQKMSRREAEEISTRLHHEVDQRAKEIRTITEQIDHELKLSSAFLASFFL